MSTKKFQPSTRTYWQGMVQDWIASGLSQGVFAKQRGIGSSTLSTWHCRLKKETQQPIVPNNTPAFLPVRLKDTPRLPSPLMLLLKNDIKLVIPQDVDQVALKDFLKILGILPC